LINEHLLTTFVNALLLSLGILITILTSFVRFKNYREILEELREKQNIMIGYIDKYNKQKNNLEFLYQTKEDDIKIEEIEKIKNDIAEYDTILVSTNILQFLTTQDIIKFNNYRLDFEYKKKEILFNYKKKIKTLEETDEENQTQHLTISNNSLSPSCEFFVL
jgi:predicted Holliday junction resolvase-like endonuclease